MDRKITEYVELDREREWAYLSRFYEVASRFYGARDRVVSEEEVEERIRSFKEKPAPRVRREHRLDRWRFALDEREEGIRKEYQSFQCSEEGWEEITVPHSLNHVPADPVRFGSTPYGALVSAAGQRWDIWTADYSTWYRARVPVGKLEDDQVAYLAFESVNLTADVWVNEMPVMIGHQGLFPFRMPVTDEMGWGLGEESVIALRARGKANNTPFLFGNGLQIAYGKPPYVGRGVKGTDWKEESWTGIAGDVKLTVVSRMHIEDAFVITEELNARRARIRCRVELRNESRKRFRGRLRVDVSEWCPAEGPEAAVRARAVDVLPMSDAVVELELEIHRPRPWTPETPSLYLAHVVMSDDGGRDLDDVFETFGVRTIRMKAGALYLNGRRIVPRGTHDLANYHGDSMICPCDRSIVMDILLSRKMGATCSRLPSDIRMHYPRIAEYADQMGFMLSWTGYFELWTVPPEMEMYARRDVRAVVRSLRNRPSVIVWEMGDEPLMLVHNHRRLAWLDLVYHLVMQEDATRPVIPAGWWSNELVELVEELGERGVPWAEARRRVLAEYPVFALPQAPWDFHHCPYIPPLGGGMPTPVHRVIRKVRDALGGQRATIFTEFGIDGMPRPGNVEPLYGGFRWTAPAIMPVDRERKDIGYYGRPVGQEDWKQSQAAQALALSCIIGQLRELPDAFAGYYFPTLVDSWTFYWGAVDAAFNAKLAWFVVRGCYAEVYVTALHTSVLHPAGHPLEVSAGSHGDPVPGATLRAVIRGSDDAVVHEVTVDGVRVPGGAGMGHAASLPLPELPDGLYAVELSLSSREGTELARRVELFYLGGPA